MDDDQSSDMTLMLQRLGRGDSQALDKIVPLVYKELKKLARNHLRREAQLCSLETTSLVHEAFIKLAGGHHPDYESRSHFYGIASRLMRQVLVETARARSAQKRGAAIEVAVENLPDAGPRVDGSLLALDDALRQLEKLDARKAHLIEMRYFAGMTAEECCAVVNLPIHAVRRELRLAQAWLRKEIAGGGGDDEPVHVMNDVLDQPA